MRANTGYKALLRYLYRREEFNDEPNADVDKLLDELRHLEKEASSSYGFMYLGNARSPRVQLDLVFLYERGLVHYHPENPHVELTELGRGFASRLEFSTEIEEIIGAYWQGSSAGC